MKGEVAGAAGLCAVLLFAGCKKPEGESVSNAASAYAGPVGRLVVFNPTAVHATDTADTGAGDTAGADTSPDTAPPPPELALTIDASTWNVTLPGGEVLALAWSITDGLVVDDTQLLPATVTENASAEGVEVTAKGEYSVWYGTFPDVATITASAGSLAGDWAFARDVGPIALRIGEEDWELVYYQ